MSKIIKWVTFEWTSWSQLFDQMIESSLDNAKVVYSHKDAMNRLSFSKAPIIGASQKFSEVDNWMWLNSSSEVAKATEIERRFGNSKGIYTNIYKNKISVTGRFYDWMKVTKSLNGASEDVQAKMLDYGKNMSYLMNNGEKTKAQVMMKVITLWEASTHSWALTPDWQPLFSASHPIEILGTTQSNLVTWTHWTDADKITKLTDAVNKLRSMRLANWDYVYTSGWEVEPYILRVPVIALLDWTRALNNLNGTSWQGSNANAVNIFSVSGFLVKVEPEPLLWSYDTDKVQIGNETACYLLNPAYLKQNECFKIYDVKDLFVTSEEIKDPRSFVTYIEWEFGASHYFAERWIVKLKGA